MSPIPKVRVLVVDDSAVVRRAIVDALSSDPEIEVVGTACDPYVARDKILELNPDVLTLDVEMPRMDGLTFLRTLQAHRPIPVVIISAVTQAGSQNALEALALGAVDVMAKPSSSWSLGGLRDQLPQRVKGAARARPWRPIPPARQYNIADAPDGPVRGADPRQLILIGASTGGTEAIKSVLTALPGNLPGICIVQHIPPVFSAAFANRLNSCCRFAVREARNGDIVQPGLALIAPGDYHMSVAFEGTHYRVHLEQGPPLNFTRPAVDVLFNSAAPWAGPGTVSVILTGMGSDGAYGMQKLKLRGACTIAQDEATCVVYGMPQAAVKLGVVDHILPLERIPEAILSGLVRRTDETRAVKINS
ncbi:MAG: chemotaxis response regulator protein-glutamate methylesterase [Opitutaceae bacterium]